MSDRAWIVLLDAKERQSAGVNVQQRPPVSVHDLLAAQPVPDKQSLPVPSPYRAGGRGPRKFPGLLGTPRVRPGGFLVPNRYWPNLSEIAPNPMGQPLPGRR